MVINKKMSYWFNSLFLIGNFMKANETFCSINKDSPDNTFYSRNYKFRCNKKTLNVFFRFLKIE